MTINSLRSILSPKKLRLKHKHRAELKALSVSRLFDERFYKSMYIDVSSDPFWSANPILHYLLLGAAENRKPAKDFDTQWYVENNPDVEESGMNPFLHYIKYGRQEGRRTNGDRYSYATRDTRELLRNTVINHLWGGYSEPALNELNSIIEDQAQPKDVRFFAAWHAARWYFYIHEYKKVKELAEFICALDSHYKNDKATAMMFVHSFLAMGNNLQAKAVAEAFLQETPEDTDMLLSLANTVQGDDDKLAIVNQIYSNRGLTLVEKRDASKPLSFANITGKAKPVTNGPLVSVIMPIFNAQDDIESAIQSLLEQAYQNIEIIVVDDRSTDRTFSIVSELAEKHSKVRAFQQEKNGGAYLARNRGLKEARGAYITTHDSDDWSHPDKIATQVELLERKEIVMGVCLHWTRALDNLTFTHNWNLNARLVHWNHSSFLFRKEVIDELGPWDSVIVGGDTEFIWRVQSHYGHGSVVKYKPNIPFSFALDDDGSLTRTKATHVKTIHNGLRHIYRSAAQWWHEQESTNKLVPANRKFPAPKGMLKRGDNKLSCDMLFIADFTVSNEVNDIVQQVKQAVEAGQSIGLMHWPVYKSEKEALHSAFFELLLKENCDAVVFGMEITAGTTVFHTTKLLSPKLETRPVIDTKAIQVLEGEQLSSEQENALIKELQVL